MKNDPQPRIIHAERLSDSVIITFEDGKCAVYSSQLLRSIFSSASEVQAEDERDYLEAASPAGFATEDA